MLQSSLPLETENAAGEQQPVDLTLASDSTGFRTRNAFVDLRIGGRSSGGVSFTQGGFSISPGGQADVAAAERADRVFFANTQTDTDFVVAPRPAGAELGWQLRSPASPERLTLDLELPAGAVLRRARTDKPIPGDPPSSFEIAKGEDAIAYIQPPNAYDADGVPVPSDAAIDGASIVVTVKHRDGDYRYPLFVDPEVQINDYHGSNWNGWGTVATPYNPTPNTRNYYGASAANCAYYCGLYLSMPTNTAYSYTGTSIYWQYRAIANTYIYAGTLGGMSHTPTMPFAAAYGAPYNTYPYVFSRWYNGIFNGTFTNWEANTNYLNQSGAYGPNPFGPTWGGASGVTHAFCLTSPGPRCDRENTPPSDHNALILGLTAQNDLNTTDINTLGSRASVTMAWANTYLNDRYNPSVSRPADKGWTNDSAALDHPLDVSVLDAGLGAYNINLEGYGPGSTQVARYAGCSGDPQRSPCPLNWPTSLSYRLNEGVNTLTLRATDVVDNAAAPQTWTEKIDRTPPELGVSGGLFDAPNGFVKLSALDGQLAGSDDLSGIKSLALTNAAGTQLAGATSACTAAECPDDLQASVALTPAELPEGSSILQLRAEDMAGNADTVEQSVKIDRTPPAAPADVTASLQPNSSDGVVVWSGSDDADLPTGEAGSGVAKYSYRWKQGGAEFTPWTETAEEKATVPNVSLGAVIDVEVRAIDGADNQSGLTTATVTTTDDPGQIDLQTTDGLPPDDSTEEARSAAVSSAQTPPRLLVRCRVGTSAELGSTNPFVALLFAGESLIQVRAPADAHCAPNEAFGAEAEAAFQGTTVTLTVCLKVYEHTPNGPSLRTLDCDTAKKRAPTFFRPLQVQAEELCRPGRVPYFTTFRFSAVSPGAPSGGGQPTGKSASVELDCNEAGAWRYTAANQPVVVPATKLAANLKAAAADPTSPDRDPLPPHGASNGQNRGWKPHHMIPAGAKHEDARGEQAVRAERLGYICGIHPNDAVNGVWLRGFKLRFDQPAYNTLDDPEETDRQYHENLHTQVYYREVADMLYPHASPSGVCLNQSGMRAALRSLRQRMIQGQMPR